MNLKITTLIEDTPGNSKLYYEHGLSLYIEDSDIKILFDTGQSGDFIKNADYLNIDLKDVNYVILSHGHYDHSGGFKKFTDKVKTPYKLILGKGFFNKKYKLDIDGTYRYIGNSFDEEFINDNSIEMKYVDKNIFYITENIMLFSDFKRNNDFETISGKFKIKQNKNYVPDDFSDEIALGIKTEKGLVVIAGCSHPGIVNISETIMERTGMIIYGIIGGTHLLDADETRLSRTISFLEEKNIKIIGMCHCTGEKAATEMGKKFKDKFIHNNTGRVVIF